MDSIGLGGRTQPDGLDGPGINEPADLLGGAGQLDRGLPDGQ